MCAKRRRCLDEKLIEKRIAEGRGTGTKDEYKPWLTIQDVPSIGIAARHSSWKHNRVVHLLSELETSYFYLLEWSDMIQDIREKFPLEDLDKAQSIAKSRGIKYPVDLVSKVPVILTTDFVLTIKDEDGEKIIARTVCYSKDLAKNLNRFEIERAYWESFGVDWGIVTEKEIPKVLSKNIEWIHKAYFLDKTDGFSYLNDIHLIEIMISELVQSKDGNLTVVLNGLDKENGCDSGTFLTLFRYCVAHKLILVDMNSALLSTMDISQLNLSVNKKSSNLRRMSS